MKKTSKKEFFKYFIRAIYIFMIIYSVVGISISFHQIALLQHNLDLSYNLALISNDLNNKFNGTHLFNYRAWEDKTFSGKEMTYVLVYWNSLFRIDEFAFWIMGYSIALGFGLARLYFSR